MEKRMFGQYLVKRVHGRCAICPEAVEAGIRHRRIGAGTVEDDIVAFLDIGGQGQFAGQAVHRITGRAEDVETQKL